MRLFLLLFACTQSSNNGNGSNAGTSSGTTGSSATTGVGGSTGSAGATGSTGGGTTGGTPFSCTPYSTWCEGNLLASCTRSGADATGYDCTRSNTSMYTYYCADQCPNQAPGYGPCCALNMSGTTTGGTTGGVPKPACVVALTAPTAVSGDSHSFVNGVSCSPPSAPDCPGLGEFSAYFYNTPKTCPPGGTILRVYVKRPLVAVGATVSLPNSGVEVDWVDVTTPANDCQAWIGSFTFNSDAPSWKVTFNLNCSSGPSVHLQGTLNGDI